MREGLRPPLQFQKLVEFHRSHSPWSGVNRLSCKEVLNNVYKPIGLMVRERFQKNGLDDNEDGRVRPDAERECEHGDRRETGILAEHSHAEAEILHQCLQHRKPPAVPVTLLGLLDAAELDQRLSTRLFLSHAAPKIVFDVHLQVALKLFRQLAVAPLLIEQSRQAQKPGAQSSHEDSSSENRKHDGITVACLIVALSSNCSFVPKR